MIFDVKEVIDLGSKKIYDVLVNSHSVYTGAYRTALVVYNSVLSSLDFLSIDCKPSVVIAFKPGVGSVETEDLEGGLLHV